LIRPIVTLRRRRVIVDVDTQRDFMLAEGKACVRNHRRILQNIRRVMAWARMKNVRVISTEQMYDESDRDHAYCIMGTDGCRKIRYTVRSNHITFPADGCTDLPRDILKNYDQVILHKRCVNPFDEPRADRILGELQVSEFIVIGATAEGAVKATALGLLVRRKSQRRQTRRNQSDVGQFMPETRGRLRLRPLPGQNAEKILRRQRLRHVSKSISSRASIDIKQQTLSNLRPCSCLTG